MKLANPELASSVEDLLLYMYQGGQLRGKVSDEQLVMILQRASHKRETKITRK